MREIGGGGDAVFLQDVLVHGCGSGWVSMCVRECGGGGKGEGKTFCKCVCVHVWELGW